MRKLIIGAVAALAVAGATGGVLVVNSGTNSSDAAAPSPAAGGGAPVLLADESPAPGSRLIVAPGEVNRFDTVKIDAHCENDEVEGVFSEAFPAGVSGRHVSPSHFEGTAVADPSRPGTFEVVAECKNGAPVTATVHVRGDG
ncbi:hypothetical protein [Saccharopolyspora taberi]|uniref:Uncharacterized protein n=1 Tax=Saccharopolyspora taberi TaxID=60895 RepID=A0ABN3VNV7_9PSEU